MHLRDHPLLTYRGIRSWPPVSTPLGGGYQARPKGEIGVLKEIHVELAPRDDANKRPTYNRIFLFIEANAEGYLGCLMIEDYTFSAEVAKLLHSQYGRSLLEIGDLDTRSIL